MGSFTLSFSLRETLAFPTLDSCGRVWAVTCKVTLLATPQTSQRAPGLRTLSLHVTHCTAIPAHTD